MSFDLQLVIGMAIAYLLYCLVLAGGVQVAINQVKPLFLDPIKNALIKADETTAEQRYLIVIYVARTLVTAVAYVYLWGGVAATRAVLGGLPASIPDIGVGVVTVALVVLGEEIIHPLVEKLYVLRDLTKELGEINISVPTDETPNTSVSVQSS